MEIDVCQHDAARFEITITRRVDAEIQISEIYDNVLVLRDAPTTIRIAVNCPECDFSAVYNAYHIGYPSAGLRWPTWLLNRLIPLRASHAAVHEACLACHVPPAQHASWDAPNVEANECNPYLLSGAELERTVNARR
mgnify:CR=1 FL=1